jgi:glycosyltransferase involved in cell wall biosynthesis
VDPDKPYLAPGKPADNEWGIQYQGPFEAMDDGAARAVRLHARALAATGIPVLLQSFSNTFRGPEGAVVGAEAMDEGIKRETQALRHTSVRDLRLRVKHLVIHSAEQLRAFIIPTSVGIERDVERAMAMRQALYRSTIVYSVWERTKISDDIAAILRRVGECWVPCEQNRQLLMEHGVERVTVVPHPWEPTSTIARFVERPAAPRDARRRFYAIGLWQPRKGFHELVGAFLRAFQPSDNVSLTVKHRATRFPGYPTPEESVAIWLEDPEVRSNGWRGDRLPGRIHLPGGHWPEKGIQRLHFESNIYVSASSGEAWNLGAFDAKVAGNRLVHVPFGGTADFAGAGDVAVPYELAPVPPEYQWEAGAKWARVDVDDLRDALRVAEVPPAFVRGPWLDASEFSRVGALMRARAEAVLGAIGP